MRKAPVWLLVVLLVVCVGLGFFLSRELSNSDSIRTNLERAEGRVKEAQRIVGQLTGELDGIRATNSRLEGELRNADVRLAESKERVGELEQSIDASRLAGEELAGVSDRIAGLIEQGDREHSESENQ